MLVYIASLDAEIRSHTGCSPDSCENSRLVVFLALSSRPVRDNIFQCRCARLVVRHAFTLISIIRGVFIPTGWASHPARCSSKLFSSHFFGFQVFVLGGIIYVTPVSVGNRVLHLRFVPIVPVGLAVVGFSDSLPLGFFWLAGNHWGDKA